MLGGILFVFPSYPFVYWSLGLMLLLSLFLSACLVCLFLPLVCGWFCLCRAVVLRMSASLFHMWPISLVYTA